MQKRFFDIGWSDESKCQACHKDEGTEKHRLYPLSGMTRSQTGDSRRFQKVGTKSENLKEGLEVAKRGIVTYTLCESQWYRGHFSVKKWKSEGFKGDVATDGSLLG